LKRQHTRLFASLLLLLISARVFAQETTGSRPKEPQASGHSAPQGHGATHEESKFPEIEALISNQFRTVSYVQPLYRGLNFEAHYFAAKRELEEEHGTPVSTAGHDAYVDVASFGGSWTFRLGEHVKLTPGFGVYLGNLQKTSPAFTFRWDIEKGWLISQGLFVTSLRDTGEEFGRVSIWDGNHVSVRWKRIMVGPSWERIHTREENEWKGGVRGAVRIARHVSIAAFFFAPKPEFRAGIVIHPAE
jgi:8-oxo-dGTP pyrophosphatase MutT (NUDIX family)